MQLCQYLGIFNLVIADSGAAEFGAVGAGFEGFADIFYQGTDVGAAADVADAFEVGVFVAY